MLLSMVIISGFFMLCSLIGGGQQTQRDGTRAMQMFVQALAWAFFFVVNLIALVK